MSLVTHLEHASTGEAVALTTANVTVAVLGIAIILVTTARDRRDSGRETGAGPAHP